MPSLHCQIFVKSYRGPFEISYIDPVYGQPKPQRIHKISFYPPSAPETVRERLCACLVGEFSDFFERAGVLVRREDVYRKRYGIRIRERRESGGFGSSKPENVVSPFLAPLATIMPLTRTMRYDGFSASMIAHTA